jgi:UDP-N-acetylmuramate dehydrogenase
MEIQENVGLAPYTTFGIGGPARWFVEAATESDVLDAVNWARDRELPFFVLGGGSNLLVSDGGFGGLVLRVGVKGIEDAEDGAHRLYRVAAGQVWDEFVEQTVRQDCSGVECLAGIPGTVGGTPVQNVGAYGQEVAETIDQVRVLDMETLQLRELGAGECGFGYRSSIFNTSERGRFLVMRVDFRLVPGGAANLRYADLQRAFPAGSRAGLAAVAGRVREIRHSKGMLLVEGDPDCRSAGSFFKNPIVPVDKLEDLRRKMGGEIPHYVAGAGEVKLAAAWLIEQAGFTRGYRLGRAGISSRHTLALVNIGGATAAEMLALRDAIVAGVETKFDISLEMEPVLLGF